MVITKEILDELTTKVKDGAYHPLDEDEIMTIRN
jgi:hypothetical protein